MVADLRQADGEVHIRRATIILSQGSITNRDSCLRAIFDAKNLQLRRYVRIACVQSQFIADIFAIRNIGRHIVGGCDQRRPRAGVVRCLHLDGERCQSRCARSPGDQPPGQGRGAGLAKRATQISAGVHGVGCVAYPVGTQVLH